MDGWWGGNGGWVLVPTEEGAEFEVLDDGELGEDFDVVHFEHSLGEGDFRVEVYLDVVAIFEIPCLFWPSPLGCRRYRRALENVPRTVPFSRRI